jgi:hypothetical protein
MANSTKNIPLRSSKAPNLLVAPVEYSQTYQDQLNNAFRLYFAQIDNFTQTLGGVLAGTTAERPGVALYIGQQFFDQTLNIPIWWNGSVWVNSSGTTV